MGMRFWKYEGLGNDFVLWFVEEEHERGEGRREESFRDSSQIPVLFSDPLPSHSLSVCDLTPSLIQNICNRHTGVGADGIILILSDASQSTPNYRIKIFNSDGSCAIMCGNGVRCVIKLISDQEDQHRRDSQSQYKEDNVKRSYEVMTDAGMVMAQLSYDGMVTILLDPPLLFFRSNQTFATFHPIHISLPRATYAIIDISLGNPHAVAFVEDLDSFERDFPVDGKALSTHEYFQGGVNAEFVQVIAPQHLRVRVWERGAGPTLACGTGACAAVVASVLMKLTLKDHPCKVTLPGGDLIICWREADQRLSLSGPANFVYEGSLPLPPIPLRR